MHSNNKFSIVTVVYNAAEMIEETIQSVVNQTYTNLEYIIIDGGSTDETVNIIRKFDNEIDKWISEKDSGIYDAMNKGISLASGQWINFMNAGDTFADSETLKKVAEQINQQSDVIYGDRFYLKNGKKTLQKARSIDTIFERMPFGHQSTFVRREILEQYKFNTTYKFSADYDLLIRLYLAGYRFQQINLPVCTFLAGGESESGLRPYLEALKIVFDYCKDKKTIAQNAYFRAFYNNCTELLKKSVAE